MRVYNIELDKNEIKNDINVDFDDIVSISKENEQLDPIDKIIKLVRSAKTEKEARKLFEEYFDLLMSCDVVQAWMAEDRREGPIDDYYLSKHDEMLDEASKVLINKFNNINKKISEFDFLRLFTSTMIIQKQNSIIDKYDLEEKLYKFYDNPEFSFLFEDICKKENVDSSYVDLSMAFETAYTLGLLDLIKDTGSVRTIINLSEEQATNITKEFNSNEVDAMNKLCFSLEQLSKENKVLKLKK